jgi:hypothetical protein
MVTDWKKCWRLPSTWLGGYVGYRVVQAGTLFGGDLRGCYVASMALVLNVVLRMNARI